MPADLDLYDYDSYERTSRPTKPAAPRWPWVVGIAAIVAAIALVVSVSLLFARTDTNKLATPSTAPTSTPPMQDEIIATTPPRSAASAPADQRGAAASAAADQRGATAASAAADQRGATATPRPRPRRPHRPRRPQPRRRRPRPPAAPRQVTYSVTGTKAPFDQITITYTDASGMRRTLPNVYIPWTITLTPISQSDVGSIEASSLLRLSKLNC